MAAGGPSSFSLMKKNQKTKSAYRLLCRTGLMRGKSSKTWAAKVAPIHKPTLLQMLLCLATAKPTIVFPDFIRSFFADEVKILYLSEFTLPLILGGDVDEGDRGG